VRDIEKNLTPSERLNHWVQRGKDGTEPYASFVSAVSGARSKAIATGSLTFKKPRLIALMMSCAFDDLDESQAEEILADFLKDEQ
jgi:hypothetical protein